MPVRMIVTDLDGTLLRADKTVSEYTIDVLTRCRARGIRLAFATARPEMATERISRMILPDAVISDGGALARCGGKTVYSRAVPQEIANEIIRSCLALPDVGYITAQMANGDYFVSRPIEPGDPLWRDYGHARYADFSRGIGGDACKITVEIRNKNTASRLAAENPQATMLAFSDENWYCFTHNDVNKWVAVRHLAARFGIFPADVAAFGDDLGDIEMLRGCGFGVAVANAVGEAKAAAVDICASNDEDGVARWLQKHVL